MDASSAVQLNPEFHEFNVRLSALDRAIDAGRSLPSGENGADAIVARARKFYDWLKEVPTPATPDTLAKAA